MSEMEKLDMEQLENATGGKFDLNGIFKDKSRLWCDDGESDKKARPGQNPGVKSVKTTGTDIFMA